MIEMSQIETATLRIFRRFERHSSSIAWRVKKAQFAQTAKKVVHAGLERVKLPLVMTNDMITSGGCDPRAPLAYPEFSITIYIVERVLGCFVHLCHHPLH